LARYQRDRARLADQLKQLRLAAGLSGARLAGRLGWPQSKISKIETLKQLPTEEDINAWASHVEASPEAVAELLKVLQRPRTGRGGRRAWRRRWEIGDVMGGST